MKKTKIVLLLVALVVAVTSLTACGNKEEKKDAKADGKVIEIKLAGTGGEKDTQSIGMQEVKKRLEATGLFKVDVVLNSALGGTDDVLEQSMQGTPVVAMSDPGRLAKHVKAFGVIQMPYILEDPNDLDKLIQSDLYKGWQKDFEEKGIKLITANWWNGSRNFVLNKEINVPADLKGQKVRTIGNDIFVDTVKALGATPTPMEQAEVYPAIEQGSLNGCELQTPAVYALKIYDVCKDINKTQHFQLVTCPVIGTKVFNSWPKEAQDAFVKTFEEVGTENRQVAKEAIENYEKELKEKGMKIHDLDKTPFIEAVQPVYKELGYEQLRDQFLEVIGKKK